MPATDDSVNLNLVTQHSPSSDFKSVRAGPGKWEGEVQVYWWNRAKIIALWHILGPILACVPVLSTGWTSFTDLGLCNDAPVLSTSWTNFTDLGLCTDVPVISISWPIFVTPLSYLIPFPKSGRLGLIKNEFFPRVPHIVFRASHPLDSCLRLRKLPTLSDLPCCPPGGRG